MLVARVSRDEVEDDLDSAPVRGCDESIGVGQRAELGMDVAIVGHVVAPVCVRRGVNRVQPEAADAEPLQVVEPVDDAAEIAHSVPVRVRKRPGIELVDDDTLPPGRSHAQSYPALR